MSFPLVLVSQDEEILCAIKEFLAFLKISADLTLHTTWREFFKKNSTRAVEAPHFFIIGSDQQNSLAIQCLQLLRSHPKTSCLPIVVVSNTEDENIIGMYRDYDFLDIHSEFTSNCKLVKLILWAFHFADESSELIKISRMIDGCFAAGNFDEALQLIKKRKALSPEPFRCFYLEARAFLGLKNYEEARSSIYLAMKDNPGSILARELLFKIFEETNDYAGVEALVIQSFDRGQRDINLYLKKGDLNIIKQQYNESRQAYLAAIALDENNVRAHEGLSILDMLGNFNGELKNTKVSPLLLARSANQKALELTELRMFKQAEAIYLSILKLPIKDDVAFKVYLNLAICMKRDKQYEKSLAYLKHCEKISPNNEKVSKQASSVKSLMPDKSKVPSRAG